MSKITTTKLNSLPQQVEENRKNINTLGSEVDTANTSIESLKTRTTTLEGKFPVSTNSIADSAITSAKVATGAITTDKVASKAITKDKIADGVLPDSCKNKLIGNFSVLCSNGAIRNCSFYLPTQYLSAYTNAKTDATSLISTLSSALTENGFVSENMCAAMGYDSLGLRAVSSSSFIYFYYTSDSTASITIEDTTKIKSCSFIVLAC